MAANIDNIQKKITDGVTDALIPADEKIQMLHDELFELKQSLEAANKDVLKNQDELRFHIERLEVYKYRVTFLGSELGKIGLLSSVDSNTITDLFAITRSLSLEIEEDLEMSNLMQERLNTITSGINQVKRSQSRLNDHLEECKETEKYDSSSIEKALGDLYAIQSDLSQQWTEIMHLRQLLHTLPSSHKIFVSPVQLERSLAAIQDEHASLEKKYELVYGLLRERLSHWKRFEQQLEIINQYISETEYMMDILTVHDHIDLKRLSQATNRLQDLQSDFSTRQVAVDDLQELASPLIVDSVVEISKNLQNTIEQTVTNWAATKDKVTNLCEKYQKAIELWKQYHDCASVVDGWLEEANEKLDNVVTNNGSHQKIGVTTNFDGCKDKLVELDGLVNEISQLLQMNAPPSKLQGKIDQLKTKFDNTQEFIVSLEKLDPRILRANNLEEATVLKSLKAEIENISTTFVPNVDDKKIDDLQQTLIDLSTCVGKVEDVEQAPFYAPTEKEDQKQEILDLWQNLFIDIYHKYQNRFTELLPNDTKGLVDFWTNYLIYIENLLGAKVPAFYSELIEEKRLLEIHRNLLSNQTRIFNQYLQDFANENPDLVNQQAEANKALDEINSRIVLTNQRLDKYDQYQRNRHALLEWFKNFEATKSDLQLRNLNLKRIPKVINEIELLIGEISTVGEKHMETLAENQNELMVGHDVDILSSLKIENIAFRQRISNLAASLNTWKNFLENIKQTGTNYEELLQNIQSTHDRHTEFLSGIEASLSAHNELSDTQVEQIQRQLNELTTDEDLSRLEQNYQQLQQCMNLGQARSLTQIIWMMQQKRHDLIHEYKNVQYSMGENENLRTSFFMVCSQFCDWMAKTQEKLLITQPSSDILCHKNHYLEAINVRENEKHWIFQTGRQMLALFKQNPKLCAEIQEKLDQVADSWSSLKDLYDSQYTVSSMSLISSSTDESDHKLSTIYSLEIRINEIREWLIQKQKQICLPFRFEQVSDAEFNAYILEQENLQKSLEQESGSIGEVLNLCEMICATDEHVKNRTNLKMLYQSMKNLDRRWKSICVLLPNRKKNLFAIWKSLRKINDLRGEQFTDDWLDKQKGVLLELRKHCDKLSNQNVKDLEVKLTNSVEALHTMDDVAHQLKYCSQDLLTNQFIHIESDSIVSSILQSATTSIKKWRDLLTEAEALEKRLQNYSLKYSEFIARYTDIMLLLTNLDVEVTNLKLSLQDGSMREKDVDDEEQLKAIREKLLDYQKSVLAAERMYEEELKPLASDYEMLKLEENVNDMLRLCTGIKENLSTARCQTVDESTQVNTLFLNTAVQVDTLNYLDSTYKHELYAAYRELVANVDKLILAANDVDASKWSKMLSSCESSLELCKHLCHVLIRDYPEFAECEKELILKLQVEENRFQECVVAWREKQQIHKIRIETSEAGDEVCTYCANLEWQAVDNDLWRLEQWLQYADKTQQIYNFKALSTYSIEQLEDIIQEHREFLLDLDSHKIILGSLTAIGDHLQMHRRKKVEQIPKFREHLDKCTAKWNAICGKETAWQRHLHKNLLANDEFYNIIDELTVWLRESDVRIRQLYPPELSHDGNLENHAPLEDGQRQLYEAKLKHLHDMRQELDQCEPRILNLQDVTRQLFIANDVDNKDIKIIYERLTKLKIGLHALQKVTNLYIIRLAIYLGYNMDEFHVARASNLHNLSNLLLDSTTAQPVDYHPAASTIISKTFKTARSQEMTPNSDDDIDSSEVQRRGRVRRILRASLPIQGILLLILGAMAILPQGQDYACSLANNFARSFEPMLSWRGPGGVPF